MVRGFLLVALGGALGSMARYGIGLAVHSTTFPYATLIVNVVGCLCIGLALPTIERAASITPEFRQIFIVGFLGGFTTFSALGSETIALLRTGAGVAFLNMAGNVVGGLLAVAIGRAIGSVWS